AGIAITHIVLDRHAVGVLQRDPEADVGMDRSAQHRPAGGGGYRDAIAAVVGDRVALAGRCAADDAEVARRGDVDAIALVRYRLGATGVRADPVAFDDRPRSAIAKLY